MAPPLLLSLVGLLLLNGVSCQIVDSALQDLTNRNADFAARLYRAVSSLSDDNVFLSPFTLSTGLSALLTATSGRSQEQLLQGLSLSGLEPQSIPDLFQNLRTLVLDAGVANKLLQGVALFAPQGFEASSTFMDEVGTKFGGSVQNANFALPQDAFDVINRWVQENLGDQVQELAANLDPQTQLLLATAASYKARFSPSFNTSLTQDERFYVNKYKVPMVPMMFRADKYYLAYDRSLKVGVLKLPMVDGTAMLVVLPDEGVDITGVEEELTGEKIRGWIRQLKKTKLEVQLPRFLLDRSSSLRNSLESLNIKQVFQDDGEMINMGGDKELRLTQVLHKAVISVDETTDDITGVGGATFSTLPPRLTINRPFLFVVYHQTSSSVLSIGRVVDPSKN